MEKFQALVQEANRAFETADHLAFITYPLIDDTKLIITIAENLWTALEKGMDAVLYYDRLYKRIHELPSEFPLKFEIFKTKSAPRYNFPRENILLINDVREIIERRKKSPIEFVRKDKFVIASNNFRLKTIDLKKIKEYISQTKLFIDKVNQIKEKNDQRFGKPFQNNLF